MQRRIENKRRMMHVDFCNFVCDQYDLFFFPRFNVSQMIRRRKGRKISKITALSMQVLGHYQLRRALMDMSEKKGVVVKLCDESYTSQMCTLCCERKTNLGGNKVHRCSFCPATTGRDVNGARNIYVRYFTHHNNSILECHRKLMQQ